MSMQPFRAQSSETSSLSEREMRNATKQERNKIIAADVARLLDLSSAQTLSYVDLIVATGLSRGDAGIRDRLGADLAAKGIKVSDARLKLCMDALMVEAWQGLRQRFGDTVPNQARERSRPHRADCAAPSLIFSLSVGLPPGATVRIGFSRIS